MCFTNHIPVSSQHIESCSHIMSYQLQMILILSFNQNWGLIKGLHRQKKIVYAFLVSLPRITWITQPISTLIFSQFPQKLNCSQMPIKVAIALYLPISDVRYNIPFNTLSTHSNIPLFHLRDTIWYPPKIFTHRIIEVYGKMVVQLQASSILVLDRGGRLASCSGCFTSI